MKKIAQLYFAHFGSLYKTAALRNTQPYREPLSGTLFIRGQSAKSSSSESSLQKGQ